MKIRNNTRTVWVVDRTNKEQHSHTDKADRVRERSAGSKQDE